MYVLIERYIKFIMICKKFLMNPVSKSSMLLSSVP